MTDAGVSGRDWWQICPHLPPVVSGKNSLLTDICYSLANLATTFKKIERIEKMGMRAEKVKTGGNGGKAGAPTHFDEVSAEITTSIPHGRSCRCPR